MEYAFWFAVFTAVNGLLVLLLALNISRLRVTRRIPFGDGGDIVMNQAIRAHANALEHITIFALLILALGMTGMAQTWLAALVLVFTLSRLVHAWGMLARVFNGRRLGAGISYLCELIAIAALFTRLVDFPY